MKIKANSAGRAAGQETALALSWLPALAGMAALFYISALPGSDIHLPTFPHSDKAVHFAAYAALGVLIAWRKNLRRRFSGKAPAVLPERPDYLGAAVGMLYGVSDEIHQIFVPMRMFAYSDMAADFLGAAAGVWAYRKFTGRS